MNNKSNSFPFNIFAIYVIFYAGQAMYNVYLNLYLTDLGFSMSSIGTISSVSTVVLVLIQPFWGIISDKSKSKNYIIGFLSLAVAIVSLCFYASKAAIWAALCVMLFTVFFSPAFTLQDNYTLELLEDGKWDFGNIRLGGTLGYALCSMLVGFIIGTNYGSIFWMMSIFFFIAGIMYFKMPQVKGYRQKHEKMKYSTLLKDKALICILIFNILYSMGTSFYFQFYPIYFTQTLGASSQMVGMLSFVSALSEVPFFWYARKLEQKFGVEKVMIFAGVATAIRWFLLFFVTNHMVVLAVNLLSGCGYVGFSYCLIKYINNNVPKGMKATAQSFNAILGTIFARILFAPLGGILGEMFGVKNVILVASLVMLIGCILFKSTFSKYNKNKSIETIVE